MSKGLVSEAAEGVEDVCASSMDFVVLFLSLVALIAVKTQ